MLHHSQRWGLMLAASLLAACGHQDPAISTPSRPHKVERKLSKETHAADNVRIRATLWDPALLTTESTGSGAAPGLVPEPPDEVRERLARWNELYVDGQTTFTVLIELLNRPPTEGDDVDVVVDPSKWRFRLDLDGETGIDPTRVEVQTLDRYPSRAAGWHWRMAFAVHFPPDLQAKLSKSGSRSDPLMAKLHVFPPYGDERRPEFGLWTARHGFQLAWRLGNSSP